MNEHEGHDRDCSHEQECPTCREVVRDPAAHHCVVIYLPDSCLQEQP